MHVSGRCPKCDSRMSPGFVLDHGDSTTRISTWQAGAPRKGWFGVKQAKAGQKEISTLRCDRCGYLENYAS